MILVTIILIYIVMAGIVLVDTDIISTNILYSPKDIYNIGYNWFGSITLFILYMIVNPFGLVWRLFYWLLYFFIWLFTVGRDVN